MQGYGYINFRSDRFFVFQFIKILHIYIYEETVFLNAAVDTRKLELLLDFKTPLALT